MLFFLLKKLFSQEMETKNTVGSIFNKAKDIKIYIYLESISAKFNLIVN